MLSVSTVAPTVLNEIKSLARPDIDAKIREFAEKFRAVREKPVES